MVEGTQDLVSSNPPSVLDITRVLLQQGLEAGVGADGTKQCEYPTMSANQTAARRRGRSWVMVGSGRGGGEESRPSCRFS
jgi:hypothetical protein